MLEIQVELENLLASLEDNELMPYFRFGTYIPLVLRRNFTSRYFFKYVD